jgi:hypothetical protein
MRGARTAIIVRNMEPDFADQSAEDEGIWTNEGSDVTVYGSIHQKNSEDVDEGTTGQLSEERNIICRIPLSASVTYGDQIVIENIHPVLNGVYEIDSLLYTKTHLRAECRRTLR